MSDPRDKDQEDEDIDSDLPEDEEIEDEDSFETMPTLEEVEAQESPKASTKSGDWLKPPKIYKGSESPGENKG